MKKSLLRNMLLVCVSILTFTITAHFEAKASDTLQVIKLPDPKPQFAKYRDSLLFALENRHSGRTFTNFAIDIHDLSALLWSACGVNRGDGKLTIPTSRNSQDMHIYMAKEDGIWFYNAKEHSIEQISTVDIRETLSPALAKQAPITFFYVNDLDKASNERSGDRHSGSMYQNVGLYCAIANLNNVVTGSFSKELEKTLKLPSNYKIMISQSIGGRP